MLLFIILVLHLFTLGEYFQLVKKQRQVLRVVLAPGGVLGGLFIFFHA